MTERRKKAGFDTDYAGLSITALLVIGLLSLLVLLFGVLVLSRALNHKDTINVIGWSCFIPILAIQTWMCVKGFVEVMSTIKRKNRWIRNAVSVQALIVDREVEPNPYAEYWEEEYQCELTLKIPQAQTVVEPKVQTVLASVSKRIYDQYVRRDVAKVFFYVDDPLVILIDGE